MKIQDILFVAVFAFLVFRKDPKLSTVFGIFSLFFSIPLFGLWVFFTAERLVWYAVAFFSLAIIYYLKK